MNRKASTLAISLALLAVAGCGSATTEPQNALVGSYTASQWVTTGTGGQTNQILTGSTLSLTLANNGTTTGYLHLAASGANPAFDADMAGTWSESNNKVTISQIADTFVRDLTLNVVPNGSKWSLTADQVVSGTRIQITLDQQ
jgi:type IV pilus biogenesis protein CpaD/CtpE